MSSQCSRHHHPIKGTYVIPPSAGFGSSTLTNAPSKKRSLLRLTAKATQFGKRTFTSWLIESAGTVPIKRRSDYSEDAQVDNTEIMSHLMDVRIPTALVRRPFRNLIFSRFRYWDLEMPSVSFRKGKAVTILPWLP